MCETIYTAWQITIFNANSNSQCVRLYIYKARQITVFTANSDSQCVRLYKARQITVFNAFFFSPSQHTPTPNRRYHTQIKQNVFTGNSRVLFVQREILLRECVVGNVAPLGYPFPENKTTTSWSEIIPDSSVKVKLFMIVDESQVVPDSRWKSSCSW